jgi:hypothetical protein
METSHAPRIESPAYPCRQGHERPRVLRITTKVRDQDHAAQVMLGGEALRGRGFDSRFVWGGPDVDDDAIDPFPGMAHSQLPWLGHEIRPGDDLRAAAAIAGVVRRWKPDVVHTHLAKAGALGRVVALRAGVPVVVHTFPDRAWNDYRSAMRSTAYAKIERRLAARTDVLIATSAWLRDELLGLGIGYPSQWLVLSMQDHPADLPSVYGRLLERASRLRPAERATTMPRGPVTA